MEAGEREEFLVRESFSHWLRVFDFFIYFGGVGDLGSFASISRTQSSQFTHL